MAKPVQDDADMEAQKPLLADQDDEGADVVDEPPEDGDDDDGEATVDDPMTYTLSWLKTWQVFLRVRDTVWDNAGLWKLMGRLGLLACVVAAFTYNLMPDPTHLDASKFSAITAVLTLFVTLMLSFFLSSSVGRWVNCVEGYLDLFNSIRNLSMQLHTLGVSQQRIELCQRYGVLSAKFLTQELRSVQLSPDQQKKATEDMWKKLSKGKNGLLKAERERLELVNDKAGQMWIWVGSLIGRMAADGDIPGMPTPTYGRIMNLAQTAQQGLRQVRTSVIVQMPFVYVHTLATLVHVNSILLAINLGLAVGTTVHGIRQYVHHYYYSADPDPAVPLTPLTGQVQTLIVEVMKGFLGPLLFQAFLEIGISVASPFASQDAAIPVARLTKSLERDLQETFQLADDPPHWEKPFFKQPAPSSS